MVGDGGDAWGTGCGANERPGAPGLAPASSARAFTNQSHEGCILFAYPFSHRWNKGQLTRRAGRPRRCRRLFKEALRHRHVIRGGDLHTTGHITTGQGQAMHNNSWRLLKERIAPLTCHQGWWPVQQQTFLIRTSKVRLGGQPAANITVAGKDALRHCHVGQSCEMPQPPVPTLMLV